MHARTNGIDTHYVVSGAGPWLVLSHSLACDGSMWDPQIPALEKDYKVLRYDTRGHGKSSAPEGPYTLDQLAADLKGLLDGLGIKSCHFAGLSMGGMIGQTFALAYPGIFKSLTLADTTSRYPAEAQAMWAGRMKTAKEQGMKPLVEGTLGRWFTEPFRKANPGIMAKMTALIEGTPVAGYAGCCAALPQINTTHRLKEIATPTAIIVGSEDAGTPVAMSQEMFQAKPGSELYIIRDAAHISNVEKPEAFTKVFADFIGRHAK
jgi:3-oxoadipate enol-lactonase